MYICKFLAFLPDVTTIAHPQNNENDECFLTTRFVTKNTIHDYNVHVIVYVCLKAHTDLLCALKPLVARIAKPIDNFAELSHASVFVIKHAG
eukprot:m.7430 g.7430  ORF g.7430 m.7430 type:complete len:92 (+) comp3713_c0_seq1:121-396(+)